MKNIRFFFILATVLIFILEVLIARYLHDDFVRPFMGDVFVVILLYCLVRIFIPLKIKLLSVYIFIFACCVEFLQYLNFIQLIGLENNNFAKIVLGTSFDWRDILCYAAGCLLCFFLKPPKNQISRS